MKHGSVSLLDRTLLAALLLGISLGTNAEPLTGRSHRNKSAAVEASSHTDKLHVPVRATIIDVHIQALVSADVILTGFCWLTSAFSY